MKIVTFYSYKGGVGRSLLLANYAHFLCRSGCKVIAIDLDLEAPGLHFKFETRDVRICNGVVDYVEATLSGSEPSPISEYLVPVGRSGKGSIDLFPAGSAPSERYNQSLSCVLASQFTARGLTLAGILRRLILQLRNERPDVDFVLIDSRTGITETGRFALGYIKPELVVCVLLRNEENRTGAGGVIRGLLASGIPVVPVLARLPMLPHKVEEKLLAEEERLVLGPDVRSEAGKLLYKFQVLHADVHLPFYERLLWPSKSTLLESALLYDYAQLFQVLAPEVILSSPYSRLLGVFPRREQLDEWSVWTLHENAEKDEIAQNTIEQRLQKRRSDAPSAGGKPRFNYVPTYFIDAAQHFRQLGDSICEELRRKTLEDDGEVFVLGGRDKHEINFDLLGVQMRQGIFEFCGEAYFLTGARIQSAAVLQFGWLRTFECLVRRGTELERRLTALSQETSLQAVIDVVFSGPDSSRVEIGMLSDSSTTLEVAPHLTSYVQGERLSIEPGHDRLSTWLLAEKEFKERIALCDHSVARRVEAITTEKTGRKDYYGSFVLQFPRTVEDVQHGIPVGFLYPREDGAWRRQISRAFSREIKAMGPKGWEQIRAELRAVRIETFSHNELRSYLVMDMTIEEALDVGRPSVNDNARSRLT